MLRVLFIIAFVTLIITILSSIFYSLHKFFEPQKRFHKFGIVGKPRPNGKYLGKKIEKKKKKKKKMKMKILKFLSTIATTCKI